MRKYPFEPVERYVAPAPGAYPILEDELPRGLKVLVFAPHSDDTRYIGGSLHYLNAETETGKPRNRVKMVVVSSGHRGIIDPGLSKREKKRIRWQEGVNAGRELGFDESQFIDFDAEKTYGEDKTKPKKTKPHIEDQRRMNRLFEREHPEMVLVPHHADTAQHINFKTRNMVMESARHWLERMHRKQPRDPGGKVRTLMVVEYPTNHVPVIPPSDLNLFVTFSDPAAVDIKHKANQQHKSQRTKTDMGSVDVSMASRQVEAIQMMTEADDAAMGRMKRRFVRHMAGFNLNSMKSRGEPFGVTLMYVNDRGKEPKVVERRVKFPLSEKGRARWGLGPKEGRKPQAARRRRKKTLKGSVKGRKR